MINHELLPGIICLCFLCKQSSECIVTTNSGTIEGKKYLTSGGKSVYSFLGVPFAKPPIGELRFKEPQPIGRWNGSWAATGYGPIPMCLQKRSSGKYMGNEDCLYLDIYTPYITPNCSLPVCVYFHGGSFRVGKARDYTPYFLLDIEDIVFVSVNYRLGALGFLSTLDDVVPGNNGLKDQVLALKWIHENIIYFGGNKNDVTIAGSSAGAASVHFHYLSPMSRGLFKKGISGSGSALNHWALSKRPLEKAIALATYLGCPSNTSSQMVECLKGIPGEQLVSSDHLFMPWVESPFMIFGPIIERSSNNCFLEEHPFKVISEGRAFDGPWMISVTSEDGLYPAYMFFDRPNMLSELDKNWLHIAPYLLDYNFTVMPDNLNNVSSKIRRFYFGEENISSKHRGKVVDMLGDRTFKVDGSKAAKLQASVYKSDVFFYVFRHRGTRSNSDLYSQTKANFGACHGDDDSYIFGFLPNRTALFDSDTDQAMAKVMQRIWMSFVYTGRPTVALERMSQVSWSPQGQANSSLHYLRIDNASSVMMISESNFGNNEFWSSLGFAENENH